MIPAAVRRGTLFLVGGAFTQAVVGFAAQWMLMRHLQPEDFGEFVVLLAGVSLVLSLLALRLDVLILRTPVHALTEELRDKYYNALTWECLFAGGITVAWLIVFNLVTPLSLMILASVLLQHWVNNNKAFFERSMSYGKIAAVETGSQIIGHLLSVILVFAGVGAAALYIREILFGLLRLGGLAMVGGLTVRRLRWLRWHDWRSLMTEARGVWLDGAIEGGFNRLVVLMIGGIAGDRGAGLFSQANRLALIPGQFIAPLVNRTAGNWFGQTEDVTQRLAALRRMVVMLVGLLSVAVFLLLLLADPVVPWVFGEQWASAVPLLKMMGGVMLFSSLFDLVKTYCLMRRLSRLLVPVRLCQYAVFLGPAAVMSWNGVAALDGLAIGFAASYGAAFAVCFWLVWRHERPL